VSHVNLLVEMTAFHFAALHSLLVTPELRLAFLRIFIQGPVQFITEHHAASLAQCLMLYKTILSTAIHKGRLRNM